MISEYTPNKDTLHNINWLFTSSSPWQECEEKWKETHAFRMKELQGSDATLKERQIIGKKNLYEKKAGSGSGSTTSNAVLTDPSSKVATYLGEYRGVKEALGYTLVRPVNFSFYILPQCLSFFLNLIIYSF